MSAINAIDLFAGPGGWDLAAKALGLDPLGIEWDVPACDTRHAAGLRTVQADVAQCSPAAIMAEFFGEMPNPGASAWDSRMPVPLDLLIASPPCPTFSSAGKGDGIADMPLVYEAAECAARGKPVPPLPWRDERSALVVEPLRWAILLEPRFLAWEQVPPVLPFWEHCAELLRRKGWNVWTGIMEAERYGVPQTRERAILMADRKGPVHPPRPTHQRFVKGEPQRHEVTLEGEILPWVSMAEALGWGMTERPNYTVTAGVSGGGPEVFGSSDVREAVKAERDRGAWLDPEIEQLVRAARDLDLCRHGYGPTCAVCHPLSRDEKDKAIRDHGGSHGLSAELRLRGGWKFRNGNQDNATERDADEPASTVAFGHNAARVEWVYDRRQSESAGVRLRPSEEPAPTICGSKLSKGVDVWTQRVRAGHTNANGPEFDAAARPARISQPGRHDPEESGSQQKDAIRVTLEEAAILQSFPPDYPFQGSKSKRFEQVGNAVPPLLAYAILSALLAPVHDQVEVPA